MAKLCQQAKKRENFTLWVNHDVNNCVTPEWPAQIHKSYNRNLISTTPRNWQTSSLFSTHELLNIRHWSLKDLCLVFLVPQYRFRDSQGKLVCKGIPKNVICSVAVVTAGPAEGGPAGKYFRSIAKHLVSQTCVRGHFCSKIILATFLVFTNLGIFSRQFVAFCRFALSLASFWVFRQTSSKQKINN